MGKFSTNTKGRAWIGTVHIANMEKAGLTKEQYENPEFLTEFLMNAWNSSGKGRTSGVAVCVSAQGCYHAHVALYGNLTTLTNVSKIMFDSHIEPQLGGKKELKSYLAKEPPYDEKGEQVLCTKGLDNVQDNQGSRDDLKEIEEMLQVGMTPQEILESSFRFYRYEKMILHAYVDMKMKKAPVRQPLYVEYHVGNSGSGKTYTYMQLCKEYGTESIYLLTDYDNTAAGGLDAYMKQGAPPILFMDEYKGTGITYGKLLIMLNGYSRMQTHARYSNAYNLWEKVFITSIYPPETLYEIMVPYEQREKDSYTQLIRRINNVVYHYVQNGEYRTYSVPASEYKNLADLRCRALTDGNGFTVVTDDIIDKIPFINKKADD